MKFKAIGFDYGGVIFGEPGSVFERNVAELLGVSVDEFKTVYFRHNHLFNIGATSLQDRWNPILKDLKREDKWEAVLDFCSQEKGINQNVLNLIDELRSKGYKLGLLSNNSLEGGVEIRKKGIDKYFDTVLISAEIGLMKPQQEIFFLLAERLGVRPEELIFIDDTPRSLEGAEKVGFHPLVFTTYESLLKDLDTLEVI